MRNFLTAGALALATVIAVSSGFAGDALARGGGGGGHGGGGGGVHIGGGGGFHGGGMGGGFHGGGMGGGFHGGGMGHFGDFGGQRIAHSGGRFDHDRRFDRDRMGFFGGGWSGNDCSYSPYYANPGYPNYAWCQD
jgi:hypothetical protein